MNHAAVVPGLVRGEPILGFEKDHSCTGTSIQQRISRGQTHNASADHRNVIDFITHNGP